MRFRDADGDGKAVECTEEPYEATQRNYESQDDKWYEFKPQPGRAKQPSCKGMCGGRKAVE